MTVGLADGRFLVADTIDATYSISSRAGTKWSKTARIPRGIASGRNKGGGRGLLRALPDGGALWVEVGRGRKQRGRTVNEVAFSRLRSGATRFDRATIVRGVSTEDPGIAVTPTGTVAIATLDVKDGSRNTDGPIRIHTQGRTERSWASRVVPGTSGADAPLDQMLSLAGSGNGLHAVWADAERGIIASSSTPDLATWSSPVAISGTSLGVPGGIGVGARLVALTASNDRIFYSACLVHMGREQRTVGLLNEAAVSPVTFASDCNSQFGRPVASSTGVFYPATFVQQHSSSPVGARAAAIEMQQAGSSLASTVATPLGPYTLDRDGFDKLPRIINGDPGLDEDAGIMSTGRVVRSAFLWRTESPSRLYLAARSKGKWTTQMLCKHRATSTVRCWVDGATNEQEILIAYLDRTPRGRPGIYVESIR